MPSNPVQRLVEKRSSRLYRRLAPPLPLYPNPEEARFQPPLGRWNLYIGGGGSDVDGYVNIDLFHLPGVTVQCNAEHLPFRGGIFQRVECDAVLEHVERPGEVMSEIRRCLADGGFVHLVVPFCHPYHEYPRDYRRFTPDGLAQLAEPLEVVRAGWRTGPTATMLAFTLEYLKLWFPRGVMRKAAYALAGWVLFPLRYLDWFLLKRDDATLMGNHCYLWARKPAKPPIPSK